MQSDKDCSLLHFITLWSLGKRFLFMNLHQVGAYGWFSLYLEKHLMFWVSLFSLLYSRKILKNTVNFVKIILLKSDNCALALRKRRFCDAKEPLLPCKTYAFGMQNNRFCNALINRWLRVCCVCEKYLRYFAIFLFLR